MKTGSEDGVVNHGFSEDCPAKSDIDSGSELSAYQHTNPTAEEEPTINIHTPGEDRRQQQRPIHHDSFSSQLASETIADKGQSSFPLDNTQAAPVNHIITEKDDYERMHDTKAFTATKLPSIPNGNPANHLQESQKTDPTENKLQKDSVSNDGFYRDVRLSIDNSKLSSGDQFYKESYCIESSYNGSTTSDTSDSCIDTCESKITNHYKLVFKYVLQRPLFCFSIWAMFYIFWGTSALPGGSLFALTILEITALCLGYVAELLELPGLLGMMAAGFILRNVPYIDVAVDLDSSVSSPFRAVSIVILLVRGALGFNTA
ncbi:Sodium/hydrogen exchanger 9B1 [Orchesella cincta]|uniref:Sodium/hydrogen exchanger 9B1 n=1 Tax=Orchesella cincta TaxID=48709 RepID=A0A1D2NL01_ORCCI|nr:Sodium/hydrogen exchanger 9B1 [Orchesella cincta]